MIAFNFASHRETDEHLVMHSESDNIEIMINDKSDEVIEELFQSLLFRYQIGLETSMEGSDFIFNFVHLFYSKYHKMEFKRRRSYID